MNVKSIIKERNEEWKKPWINTNKAISAFFHAKASTVKFLGSTPLNTEFGNWTYAIFGDYTNGRIHTAMMYGKTGKGLPKLKDGALIRMHSSCATSEIFHATNCECREELEEALSRIRKEGSGMLIYLDQEGAGNGMQGKIGAYGKVFLWSNGKVVPRKDRKNGEDLSIYWGYKQLGYEKENRSFKAAADILKFLKLRRVRLLTNNPKKAQGLIDEGISIEPVSIHIKPKNKVVATHLKAKAKELGHKISDKEWKLGR